MDQLLRFKIDILHHLSHRENIDGDIKMRSRMGIGMMV